MNNTFYVVRSAETDADMEIPVSKWELNTEGIMQAEGLAGDKVLKKTNVIVSSDEIKSMQTASPLARKRGIPIDTMQALRELKRDKSPVMDIKTWNFGVKYAMKNPDKSKFEWERASTALARFSDKLLELDMAYNKKKIIVVSSGIVVNMYLAQLQGKLFTAFERMQKSGYCSYGIVKDAKVIKDII